MTDEVPKTRQEFEACVSQFLHDTIGMLRRNDVMFTMMADTETDPSKRQLYKRIAERASTEAKSVETNLDEGMSPMLLADRVNDFSQWMIQEIKSLQEDEGGEQR